MTSLSLKLVAAALGAVFCLAACAQTAPAPEPYTAETTYAKLAPKYPFIKIASSEVPATVEALRGITYVRHGGRELQLDLYLPKARATKALPGIVFVHGGGWRTGVRANFAPMAIRMAERGYAAATVSYRLSPEAPYPAAIHDVKAALRWMRAHAGQYAIDPARLAVAGGSAGGQIASLVGVTNGDGRFDPDAGAVSSSAQAIVNIDGLSDFTSEAARKYEDDPAKQPSSRGALARGLADLLRECGDAADPVYRQRAGTLFGWARGDDCEDGGGGRCEPGAGAAGDAAQFLAVRSVARADGGGDGAVFG
jgi:pectinesterase